ncbi:nucleoside transporter [Catalinimonas alkaloidigena]|uniref:Nucleoside transporter n=1 Tax=Catalinimonas alkaloidigena TaxID=1075417 RepID=A0A1G9K6W5_9BACT|nr:nucleoside permease [Catalinimonas alkaloidigena]SDL45105.1 nucleoside transporter [Catalinimonas alkaloidigena]
MPLSIRLQLSVMMFLQYFIWGSWYVTMGAYLDVTQGFSAIEVGTAYGALSIAAMISPFFVGMVADRFFATERVMGVLHLVGGVLLYLAAQLDSFATFYPCLLAYTLCYTPTMALSNSLSFQQMADPGKQFPTVRVLGTFGWIASNLLVSQLGIDTQASIFHVGAAVSVALGIYSFFLPHTPPKAKGTQASFREILGLDALKLMKNVSFAVLVISSMLICIPLSFYYAQTSQFLVATGISNAAATLSLGQAMEALFLLLMPLFFVQLGVKKMMLFGMISWVIRYLLFAFGGPDEAIWMLYAGILLHGICYDFFFVTGQIYVDKRAPAHLRSSAQGMITFATYGLGMLIGTWFSGVVVEAFTADELRDWTAIWLVPAGASAVVFLVFLLLFKEKESKAVAAQVA